MIMKIRTLQIDNIKILFDEDYETHSIFVYPVHVFLRINVLEYTSLPNT